MPYINKLLLRETIATTTATAITVTITITITITKCLLMMRILNAKYFCRPV